MASIIFVWLSIAVCNLRSMAIEVAYLTDGVTPSRELYMTLIPCQALMLISAICFTGATVKRNPPAPMTPTESVRECLDERIGK